MGSNAQLQPPDLHHALREAATQHGVLSFRNGPHVTFEFVMHAHQGSASWLLLRRIALSADIVYHQFPCALESCKSARAGLTTW